MAFESVKVGETKTEASSQSSPLPRSELTPSEAFIRCVPEEDEVLLRTMRFEGRGVQQRRFVAKFPSRLDDFLQPFDDCFISILQGIFLLMTLEVVVLNNTSAFTLLLSSSASVYCTPTVPSPSSNQVENSRHFACAASLYHHGDTSWIQSQAPICTEVYLNMMQISSALNVGARDWMVATALYPPSEKVRHHRYRGNLRNACNSRHLSNSETLLLEAEAIR